MTNINKNILAVGVVLLLAGIGLFFYDAKIANGKNSPTTDKIVDNSLIGETEARLREAEVYLRQNSLASARQAQTIFTRIYSIAALPGNLRETAHYGLAVALYKQGEKRDALEHFKEMRKAGVKNKVLADRITYQLGKLYLQMNRGSEGLALLSDLLARTEDLRLKSKIHTALGMYYLHRRKRQKARENFTSALRYYPNNLQAELGRAESISGRQRRLGFDSYYDDYIFGVTRLSHKHKREIRRKVHTHRYDEARRAYRRGAYTRAAQLFRLVSKEDPNPSIREKARYWRAESFYSLGRYSEAYKQFGRVLKNHRREMDQPARLKRGIILYRRGKLKRAAAEFHRAESGSPGGRYTSRAREWRREMESQIRDNSLIERGVSRGRREKSMKMNSDRDMHSSEDHAADDTGP